MVNISWNKILKLKEEDQNFLPQDSNANYTVFYSLRKEDYESMQSVCYLVHNTNRELGHTNSTSLNAKLLPDKYYYINVLANMPDNQQFAYSPVEIINRATRPPIFIFIVGILLIIFLGVAVFCLYKKYKSTRKRLDYEMQDVRNMANTIKSDEQISEIQNQNKINKYATLTEENNASKI